MATWTITDLSPALICSGLRFDAISFPLPLPHAAPSKTRTTRTAASERGIEKVSHAGSSFATRSAYRGDLAEAMLDSRMYMFAVAIRIAAMARLYESAMRAV